MSDTVLLEVLLL